MFNKFEIRKQEIEIRNKKIVNNRNRTYKLEVAKLPKTSISRSSQKTKNTEQHDSSSDPGSHSLDSLSLSSIGRNQNHGKTLTEFSRHALKAT